MSGPAPRLIRRYRPAQRVIHWMGVGSFAALLGSGVALLIPSLAFLTAGGATRLLHRIAALPFLVLPVAYALLLPREAKELLAESLTYGEEDLRWLRGMPGYLLGRTRGLPPQGRLNAGQKLHHAATFLMFAVISASGLVLWLGKGGLGAAGLGWTALVHDLSMLVLSVLAIGHLYFTFLYDALSAMGTGYVTEEYARMEHRRWVESLPPDDGPGGAGAAAPGAPRSGG